MKKGVIVPLFLVAAIMGFIGIYTFFPNNGELPKLGQIDSFQMNTFDGNTYHINSNKIKLVMFYYTRCPDICPLTMTYASPMQDVIKEEGLFSKEVEFVSITLDPDVDTPEVIKHYANSFNADFSGWLWLRGTNEQTKKVAEEFKMMYQKNKDGFVAHNTTMYLLDEQNLIRGIYDMATKDSPLDTEKIVSDILNLAEK